MKTLPTLTGILFAVVMAATSLTGAVTANAATSAGAAAVGNNYQIKNVTTDKCIDVKGESTDPGAVVHQWTCTDQPSQYWSPRDVGNGFSTLENQNSGYCLAVQDDANINGAQIIQADCNNAVAGQQWHQTLLDASGTSTLTSALGKCLEVDRAKGSNGAKIQIWDCSSASNAQKWKFQ